MIERHIIVYRDLPHDNMQGCELLEKLEEGYFIIQPGVVPGLPPLPDLYIRNFRAQIKNKQILIVTYTEKEVDLKLQSQIVEEVKKFLIKQKIITRRDLT